MAVKVPLFYILPYICSIESEATVLLFFCSCISSFSSTWKQGRRFGEYRVVVVSCVLWRKVFLWRRFLLLIVFKFHHTMLVLNAFLAISEGLVSGNQSSPPPPSPLERQTSLSKGFFYYFHDSTTELYFRSATRQCRCYSKTKTTKYCLKHEGKSHPCHSWQNYKCHN